MLSLARYSSRSHWLAHDNVAFVVTAESHKNNPRGLSISFRREIVLLKYLRGDLVCSGKNPVYRRFRVCFLAPTIFVAKKRETAYRRKAVVYNVLPAHPRALPLKTAKPPTTVQNTAVRMAIPPKIVVIFWFCRLRQARYR